MAVTEYALNPRWMYVESDPAEVLEVAVFSVLLGGALGILAGLSRLKSAGEPPTGGAGAH